MPLFEAETRRRSRRMGIGDASVCCLLGNLSNSAEIPGKMAAGFC
jgi:hypothetical protein